MMILMGAEALIKSESNQKEMLPPVRCWTCGKPLGHLWEKFKERVLNGEPPGKVLDELGVKRYCCRRTLLGHVELIDVVLEYSRFRD